MEYYFSGNVAQGKDAFQSSEQAGGLASRGVDGNANSNYPSGSCTHTSDADPNPYWGVDLGSVHVVTHVEIVNRADCCCK